MVKPTELEKVSYDGEPPVTMEELATLARLLGTELSSSLVADLAAVVNEEPRPLPELKSAND